MLRYFADRRMRARGYGVKIEQGERDAPDPAREQRRSEALAALSAIMEEQAREGKPPVFAENAQKPVAVPKQSDAHRRQLAGPPAPERW
jgi:hypothetical protein